VLAGGSQLSIPCGSTAPNGHALRHCSSVSFTVQSSLNGCLANRDRLRSRIRRPRLGRTERLFPVHAGNGGAATNILLNGSPTLTTQQPSVAHCW